MTIQLKTCRGCGAVLPVTQFYVHGQMADGRLNHCKDCVTRRVSKHRTLNIAAIREYDQTRNSLPHRVAERTVRCRAFRKRYPEKYKAHASVTNALRSGKLVRLPCAICGAAKTEAHHEDYAQPLMVTWLCALHHRQLHYGWILPRTFEVPTVAQPAV